MIKMNQLKHYESIEEYKKQEINESLQYYEFCKTSSNVIRDYEPRVLIHSTIKSMVTQLVGNMW